jgi:hypothetical protein
MLNAKKVAYNQKIDSIPNIFQNRIVRYFSDIHMGNSHQGLREIAKKHGVDVNELPWGEFVIFVNARQTMLKMYSQGGMIAHLRMPDGVKIDPRTIRLLPKFFNGKEINYSKAIEKVIHKDFGIK